MPSVSKTKEGSYRVQWYDARRVKRQKTFKTRAEAKQYAAVLELSPKTKAARITVKQLLLDYQANETPKKRGAKSEYLRLSNLAARPFARMYLEKISSADIERYVRDRLKEPSRKIKGNSVAPATVKKELTTLSAVFTNAVKLGLMAKNPCQGVKRPAEPDHRERTASEEDIKKLMEASSWDGVSVPQTETQLVMIIFLFACATGMRSHEILSIEECWIKGRALTIPEKTTKTLQKRKVALSNEALRLLDLARKAKWCEGRLFGILTDGTRDALFRKIRSKAGLGDVVDNQNNIIEEGLHFHDSRATFCTWAASPNPKTGAPRLDVMTLARQLGHKKPKMLMKYYRPTMDDIAKRLDE